MGGFDRGSRGGGFKPRGGAFRGGRGGFGGHRDEGRDDRPKEMFDAICSSCGKDCQVPFRPSGGKPVFCRDCFSKEGGGRELGRQAGERGHRRDFGERDSARVSVPSIGADAGMGEVKRQLEQVNIKLERLISAVQALAVVNQSAKPALAAGGKTLSTVLKEATKPATKKPSKKSPKK